MPEIELSEMTEDLVFAERPAAKAQPTPSKHSHPLSTPASQPTPNATPPASIEPLPLNLDTTTSKTPFPALTVAPTAEPSVSQTPPRPVATTPPLPAAPTPPLSVASTPPLSVASTPPLSVASTPPLSVASTSTSAESEKKRAVDVFESLISSAAKGGASDLLLKKGQVPMFRWNGDLFPSRNGPRMDSWFFDALSSALFSAEHFEKLKVKSDVDFGYQSLSNGRIRVNFFRQCGDLSLVARLIPAEIPTFEKLEMDHRLKELVEHKRGLVLVTGSTGSGKSTTLAALLDYINNSRTAHVITIEDPIEFFHRDKRSLFNQRELGSDTRSYAEALRSALRQAPDVILVGELRDAETIEIALQAAETGHLVLSTMHTNDAADAILRILGVLGHEKETIVRSQIADCLRGVISQRLVKRADRPGRIAAQEVMINTATIRERLLKGAHPSVVRDYIAQSSHQGMRTFDQHLLELVKQKCVDPEEALRNASNRDDFSLAMNGVSLKRDAS